jgi:F0F1-type ATP synthase assembly protein I
MTDPASSDRAWVAMVGVGFSFVASSAAGSGLGYLIDEQLSTAPWCLIVGSMLGVTIATWNLLRHVSQMDRKQRNNRP